MLSHRALDLLKASAEIAPRCCDLVHGLTRRLARQMCAQVVKLLDGRGLHGGPPI